MLNKLTRFADKYDMFPGSGGRILAAVSGGPDSVCLLEALAVLSETRGFLVTCAHYNHRLRGDESDRDEAFVRSICQRKGIPFYTGGGDVRTAAAQSGKGLEEAAREMRYAFLTETASKIGAVRIATAHTADDNTETVLMNLTRGAGLNGLGGIPPVRGIIVRPMLAVTRREILEFLSERGAGYVEDSTNALDVYTRNLIRHKVVPVLTELNPALTGAVLSASELLREDEAFLSGLAGQFITDRCSEGKIPCSELNALPRPVASRVVRQMAGKDLSLTHVEAVLALCRKGGPSGEVSLPALKAVREYGAVLFVSPDAADGFKPVELVPGEKSDIPELRLTAELRPTVCSAPGPESEAEIIHKTFNTFLFKYDNICGKIVIRPRKTGDKIELFSRGGTKTLKRLFIEEHIPKRLRSRVPVVADDVGPLAVYGIGQDIRALPVSGSPALEIIFEETAYEK